MVEASTLRSPEGTDEEVILALKALGEDGSSFMMAKGGRRLSALRADLGAGVRVYSVAEWAASGVASTTNFYQFGDGSLQLLPKEIGSNCQLSTKVGVDKHQLLLKCLVDAVAGRSSTGGNNRQQQ